MIYENNTDHARALEWLRAHVGDLRSAAQVLRKSPWGAQLEATAAAIDEAADEGTLALASLLPGAPSDDLPTLLDNLMRAAFDDGDRGREKFSGATMAARAAVLTHVRGASAPPGALGGVDGMVMVQASDLKTLAEFADRGMRGNPAKLAALRAKAILAVQQQGGRADGFAANRQEGE